MFGVYSMIKAKKVKKNNDKPHKIDNLAAYLFHQGTNYHTYEYLGVHRTGEGGCFVFRVWAPNADSVFVVGDFNGWTETMPMSRISDGGIWEYIDKEKIVKPYSFYKFKIHTDGCELYKADPYGFYCEKPSGTASVVYESSYKWRDGGWLNYRNRFAKDFSAKPINIYEVHLGSWRKCGDEFFSYREIAEELSVYVKQMGYTHVEIMPVAEHPFDGSWGHQVCGYYAPTSRYGEPDDFRAFVDKMHEAGIGVILDWVPAHFPKDAHGLYEFDGRPLYEYQGADRIEHASWGTRRFDVGREEIQSFLVSNAIWWLKEYHIDGLRVDAVSSMLYLGYDKKLSECFPSVCDDKKCLEAVAFFKKLNSAVKELCPDALMIAEESTAFPSVTGFENDGLGFDIKWDMGWINDTLEYTQLDPMCRKNQHNKMTFSIAYAFGERYVLPISHDEVVHGKLSLLDRMPGGYEDKFAGARAFAAYMMTHPGKKLMFMGIEIGQFREWDYMGEIEWFLLDYDMHAKLQLYFSDLNHFYLKNPSLWKLDSDPRGFEWINADDDENGIISFRRTDCEGDEVVVVLNFTHHKRQNYEFGVPIAGVYKEVFNSDDVKYGGSGVLNIADMRTFERTNGKYLFSLKADIPAFGAVIFKRIESITTKI